MKIKLLSIISIIIIFYSCSDTKPADTKPTAPVEHYELAKIENTGVAGTIKLPAQLAAYEEVSIFPKVNGYVQSVMVDIGSQVKKGQLLMKLEAPELEQASLQAKEKYARSQSEYTIAKENYERLRQASLTPGAISPLDLASAKEKAEADSATSNAEKANWEIQQTQFGYLKVIAPFDGVITERNVHPGALVSAEAKDSRPMLELKQVAHLRLQVDVPETFAGVLKDKDTISFYPAALPGKKMTGYISRKSMNVNMQYRTERIEIDVWNKDGILSPGMYADIILTTKGNRNALSVPASAVVTSTERKYILVVRDGKARKVDVSTGNETDGKIEIFGQVKPGDEVVAHANDEIKDGSIIK